MRLSREQLGKVLKIELPKPLSGAETARAQYVCGLLVELRQRRGMGDLAVFRAAGIEPPFCRYLHALHTCPDSFLEFCKRTLETVPGSSC